MIPKFRAFVKSGTKQVNGLAYDEDAMVPVGVLDITGGEVTVWGCGRENCGMCDDYFRMKDIILMQSTGLYDKNGKEIYEGDIVAFEDSDGGYEYQDVVINTGIVEYGELGFYFTNRVAVEMDDFYIKDGRCDDVEVIGNVHENPELEVEE